MKKTRVAIIRSSTDPVLITLSNLLTKNAKSDVLELIAPKKNEKVDLAQYDYIYVMFNVDKNDQYEEFVDFCNLYRDFLKNATLVLNCPIKQKDYTQIEAVTEKIKSFYNEIWTKYCEKRKEIISVSETKIKRIAPSLSNHAGFDWLSEYDLTGFEQYSLIVTPYFHSDPAPPREPDKAGSSLYILIGMTLTPIILIMFVAMIYTGNFSGLRLAPFLLLGIVLLPIGRSNLIFNRWSYASYGDSIKSPDLLSLVPGFGHFWIKEKLNGFLFLTLFVFPLVICTFVFYLGPSEVVIPFIPYSLLLWITGSVLAMLDTDIKYDNKMMKDNPGPYLDSFFDTAWIKRKKRTVAVFVCMMFLTGGLIQVLCEFGSEYLNLIVTGSSFVILLYLMVLSLFTDGTKQPLTVSVTARRTDTRKTIILHSGVMCSQETRRIARGYSADVMNMFKHDTKQPLDLSSYDNILIDFSPKMFKKIPRSYLKFFEVNAGLLENAGFIHHLKYSLRPSWSLEKLPIWVNERIQSYKEQFNKDYTPYIMQTSGLRIDRVFSEHLSSCLDCEILPPASGEYHSFKNSVVICPDNLNYYANKTTLFSALAVMPFFIYFMGMIFDLNLIVPACLSISLAAAVFLIQILFELLTGRQKIFLYRFITRFTDPAHVKICAILPILGLIGLSLVWGSYLF